VLLADEGEQLTAELRPLPSKGAPPQVFRVTHASFGTRFRNICREILSYLETSDSFRPSPLAKIPLEHWREFSLGELSRFQGARAQAIDFYQRFVDKAPYKVPGYLGLAKAYLDSALECRRRGANIQGPLSQGWTYLRQVRKITQNLGESYRLQGEFFIQQETWGDAERSLKRALELDPNDYQTYVDFTWLHPDRYRDLGFANSEDLLSRAIFLNPLAIEAYLLLGDYYQSHHDVPKAIQTYQVVLEFKPNDPKVLLALGKLYLSQQRFNKAASLYREILGRDSTRADVLYNLGVTYFLQGSLDTAMAYFRQATVDDRFPDAYLYLGYIAEKRGDRSKAIEYFRKRIEYAQGPDDTFAEEARKQLYRLLHQNP